MILTSSERSQGHFATVHVYRENSYWLAAVLPLYPGLLPMGGPGV